MHGSPETIFALSSGALPAGVAVVRVSGPAVRMTLASVAGGVPPPRLAAFRSLRDQSGELLDQGLVLFFPAPGSFTGEDVAEFQVHGGRAVVKALLSALGRLPGLREAEAGEFTRRAFDNGRLDLSAAEGLADLVAAETEAQRRMAQRQAGGELARKVDGFRGRMIASRALVEAELDFADEEDVPPGVSSEAFADVARLVEDIRGLVAGARYGERLRRGFEVVILGPPNAGKSTLLNRLARRDVAIVTPLPGTTRDVLEVSLDLAGLPVTLVDTAGVRAAEGSIEAEGIRRGLARAREADLVLWLEETPQEPPPLEVPLWRLHTKADEGSHGGGTRAISGLTGQGVEALLSEVAGFLAGQQPAAEPLVARERQRHCLEQALEALTEALRPGPLEVRADALRRAGNALERLTGRIDVEEVLGAVFAGFCIGK